MKYIRIVLGMCLWWGMPIMGCDALGEAIIAARESLVQAYASYLTVEPVMTDTIRAMRSNEALYSSCIIHKDIMQRLKKTYRINFALVVQPLLLYILSEFVRAKTERQREWLARTYVDIEQYAYDKAVYGVITDHRLSQPVQHVQYAVDLIAKVLKNLQTRSPNKVITSQNMQQLVQFIADTTYTLLEHMTPSDAKDNLEMLVGEDLAVLIQHGMSTQSLNYVPDVSSQRADTNPILFAVDTFLKNPPVRQETPVEGEEVLILTHDIRALSRTFSSRTT